MSFGGKKLLRNCRDQLETHEGAICIAFPLRLMSALFNGEGVVDSERYRELIGLPEEQSWIARDRSFVGVNSLRDVYNIRRILLIVRQVREYNPTSPRYDTTQCEITG